MRRVLILAIAGLALAGCSSLSLPATDVFSSAPPILTLQIDSRPAGATAATPEGLSCKTPCSLQVAAKPSQSVTFTLDKHLPQTVPLQLMQRPGPADYFGFTPTVTDFDPNPVFAELQPTTPPRKAKKPPVKKKPPPPAEQAPTTSPPPAASGAFPPPMR